MEDDDDADRRQLVIVVRVLVTPRVAVVRDVAFQRRQLTPSHVSVTTTTTSSAVAEKPRDAVYQALSHRVDNICGMTNQKKARVQSVK